MKAVAAPPRERGLIMNPIEVRAILAGRKTVFRRVVANQDAPMSSYCPFGAVGDLLWVREKHATPAHGIVAYDADGMCGAWVNALDLRTSESERGWILHGYVLQASGYRFAPESHRCWGLDAYGKQWLGSSQMKRQLSRILLRVTSLGMEPLQTLTYDRARNNWDEPLAEGMTAIEDQPGDPWGTTYGFDGKQTNRTPWAAFVRYWDALALAGQNWDKNPWVWRVGFEVVSTPAKRRVL